MNFSGRKNFRNNRKGGTAGLRSRTCIKRNAVFGARFKGLSLYFLHQKANLIRIKTGLDTCLIRIQTRTPLSRYPPYDYSKKIQKKHPPKPEELPPGNKNPPEHNPPKTTSQTLASRKRCDFENTETLL